MGRVRRNLCDQIAEFINPPHPNADTNERFGNRGWLVGLGRVYVNCLWESQMVGEPAPTIFGKIIIDRKHPDW